MRFYFKTFMETLDIDSPLTRLQYFLYSFVSVLVLSVGTVGIESLLNKVEPSAAPEIVTGPLSLIFFITLATATLRRLRDAGLSLWLALVPGISLIQFLFPSKQTPKAVAS
jgi:uncharacterized membrane protein YhaH (DUF805 family)